MGHSRQQLRELGHRVGLPDEHVNRRTTTLAYPGTNDVVRRTKLDLPVPGDRTLPVIGRNRDGLLVPYPVGFAERGLPLVGFSLTVNDASASLLTRAENQQLTTGALLALLPPHISDVEQVRADVDALVTADDSATAEAAALNVMAELVTTEDGNIFLQNALEQSGDLDARAFGRILDRLIHNYVLYARVPDDSGHALISREADHAHPWAKPTSLLGWWDAQAERWLLRWPTAQVDPEAADAASTHLEITLPEGVAPVVPDRDGYALDHAYLEQLSPDGDSWSPIPGETSGSRLHFYTHSRLPTTDAAARFQIRIERGGWLRNAALLSTLAAVVATSVGLAYGRQATTDSQIVIGDEVISMVTALLSVGMALVIRQGHELVTRMLGAYRWILTVLAVLTFLAAVATAIPVADASGSALTYADDLNRVRLAVWWASAAWAWAFVLLQAAGWFMRRTKPKNRPWWPVLQVATVIVTLSVCGLLRVPREATGMAAVEAWSALYFLRALTLRRALAHLAP